MEESNILKLLADLTFERDFLLEEIEEVNSLIYEALSKLEELKKKENNEF